jgi:hypothetical protein
MGNFYMIYASSYFISPDTIIGYNMTRETPADIVQARLQATKEGNRFKGPFAISDRTI